MPDDQNVCVVGLIASMLVKTLRLSLIDIAAGDTDRSFPPLTTLLADGLHLTTVEIDEFWSFGRKKMGWEVNPMLMSGGDGSCKTGPVGSLPRGPRDVSVMTSSSER